MSGRAKGARAGRLDAPTAGDHRRLRQARREARARAAEIVRESDAAMLMAFRAELGAVVRSASPLLISLLALEGMTLDDAVGLIEPQAGWPRRPRLSGGKGAMRIHTHLLRHSRAGLSPTQITVHPLHGCRIDRLGGGYLHLQVADHSLDLDTCIGPVWIRTRFGELRVELAEDIPETILTGCVGRLIEEIVDHEALRGRGWRIVAIEEGYPLLALQTLIVATGSVEYRMPWAR